MPAARSPMHNEIAPEFWLGAAQFNDRQFYTCHDTLEAIWMEAMEPQRTFYQGVLQVAVGLYHLENRNWRGAVMLLGEGIRRLSAYQPDYGDVNVTRLVAQSAALLHQLQHTGEAGVEAVGRSLLEAAADGAIALPTVERLSP